VTYFPLVAGTPATPVTLYESPAYASIYSSHIQKIVEHCVISALGVRSAALRAPNRGTARTALARQVAMYLAHVACGLSLTNTGCLFRRDRTTAAHACSVIEDLRDDPVADRALTVLEAAMASLMRISKQERA
jgi:chromosomal replication initiation ATPase DnaA